MDAPIIELVPLARIEEMLERPRDAVAKLAALGNRAAQEALRRMDAASRARRRLQDMVCADCGGVIGQAPALIHDRGMFHEHTEDCRLPDGAQAIGRGIWRAEGCAVVHLPTGRLVALAGGPRLAEQIAAEHNLVETFKAELPRLASHAEDCVCHQRAPEEPAALAEYFLAAANCALNAPELAEAMRRAAARLAGSVR